MQHGAAVTVDLLTRRRLVKVLDKSMINCVSGGDLDSPWSPPSDAAERQREEALRLLNQLIAIQEANGDGYQPGWH